MPFLPSPCTTPPSFSPRPSLSNSSSPSYHRGSGGLAVSLDYRQTFLQEPGTCTKEEKRRMKREEAWRFAKIAITEEAKILSQDAKGYISQRKRPWLGKFLREEARFLRGDCRLWRHAWKAGMEPSRDRSVLVVPKSTLKAKARSGAVSPATKIWYERANEYIYIGPDDTWGFGPD